MKEVSFTLDPANPPTLSPEEQVRLDNMSDAKITAAAESDPDNPPLTQAELAEIAEIKRARASAAAKAARARTGLSQAAFAQIFRISAGRLRDIEQGRKTTDSALLAYLQVIAAAPDVVRKALGVGGKT
jgi:putative transcriptional regulator